MGRSALGRARLGAALVGAILGLWVLSPASALTNAKVTLDKETGGQPTRFTLVAVTDEDARTSSAAFDFPEGFDISGITFDVVILDGLVRVPVEAKGGARGSRLEIGFDPPVAPGSNLRVQVYDVVTTGRGGDYEIGVTYSAEVTGSAGVSTEARTAAGLPFSYVSPPVGEAVARWLDTQAWVDAFNEVKALGLFFKPQLIAMAIPVLFTGWIVSILLVVVAFPLAIAAGLGLAFMKMSKVPPVRWVSSAYINLIRGTPLFLQIFVAFIGLRIAGVRASDFITGVAVLALNSSAYLAEIFRAGIQSIHKGQFEAASSLGMTYAQAMRYVIIPQTVRRVLPTMTSEFILLFKDTALLAAVGIFELMMRAQNMVARSGNLTPFVVAAVYYLIVTIPLINWVGRLEAKLAVSEHGQAVETKTRRSGLFWRSAGPVAGTEGTSE